MSLLAILLIAVAAGTGPSFNAAAQAEYEILRAEPAMRHMHVVFEDRPDRHELEWRVTVLSADYPRTVRISWVRPRTDGSLPASTVRLLTGLEKSRTFGPVFGLGDPDETDWTAPWVSREVIRELRTGKVAYNFRTGGWNLSGLFAGDLKVEEEILYPVEINGNDASPPSCGWAVHRLEQHQQPPGAGVPAHGSPAAHERYRVEGRNDLRLRRDPIASGRANERLSRP